MLQCQQLFHWVSILLRCVTNSVFVLPNRLFHPANYLFLSWNMIYIKSKHPESIELTLKTKYLVPKQCWLTLLNPGFLLKGTTLTIGGVVVPVTADDISTDGLRTFLWPALPFGRHPIVVNKTAVGPSNIVAVTYSSSQPDNTGFGGPFSDKILYKQTKYLVDEAGKKFVRRGQHPFCCHNWMFLGYFDHVKDCFF